MGLNSDAIAVTNLVINCFKQLFGTEQGSVNNFPLWLPFFCRFAIVENTESYVDHMLSFAWLVLSIKLLKSVLFCRCAAAEKRNCSSSLAYSLSSFADVRLLKKQTAVLLSLTLILLLQIYGCWKKGTAVLLLQIYGSWMDAFLWTIDQFYLYVSPVAETAVVDKNSLY